MQQVEVGEGGRSWPLAPPAAERRFHLRHVERRLLVGGGDFLCLLAALTLAVSAMNAETGVRGLGDFPLVWSATLVGLWLLMGPAFDAYAPTRIGYPVPSALTAAQAGLATAVAYFLTPYLSAPLLNSRAVMLTFAVALVVLLAAWRSGVALVLGRLVAPRRVLVVGAGWGGRTIAEAIGSHGEGYRLVGFVDDQRAVRDDAENPMVLGGRSDLARVVEACGVTDVVITDAGRMHGELVKAVVRAYESGVHVVPMAGLYEQLTGRIPVEHVGDDWTGAMPQIERLGGLSGLMKRGLDVVGGLVGLVILVLLTPFIALAIRVDSSGPIFYAQERVGFRGRRFKMWKFRSMVQAAEPDGRARWSSARDPRVTRVGRFLRVSGLDELTQVLNILRGEMSLVGPRPERPEFVTQLEGRIPFYRARLLVKPGLTGWAQIKFKYGSSADDALVKLQYDLYYVKHRSLLLDLLILLKTVGVVLKGRRL